MMNTDFKNTFIFSFDWRSLLIAFAALSCIWPLQFISHVHFTEAFTSVDASWMLTLSKAWEQQKVWGNEIVFTYGPLSFLSTRVLMDGSIWPLILFDVYFAASFLFIIYKVTKNSFTWRRAAVIVLTCFLYKQAMLLSLVFTLQLIAILYLNQYRKGRNLIYILQAILITTLIFYIKLNLAFAAILIFIIYIFYLKALDCISWKYVVTSIITLLVVIQFSSLALPVNLYAYVVSGIELIVSYNDAVYIYPDTFFEKTLSGSIVAICIFIAFYILKELRNTFLQQKIIYSIFLLLLFILFKQSYVRADVEHLKDFFYCAPACILIFVYVSNFKTEYMYLPLTILWIVSLSLIFFFKDYLFPVKKILAFPAYLYSSIYQPNYYKQQHLRKLPLHVTEAIGKGTVDIIPWESSAIILNKLNYNPRPVIQSYQAYNETLDKINEQYYLSDAAPDFVLYSINSIDHHYHFFDDTYLKKALYKRYYNIDTFTCEKEQMILFKKSNIRQQKEFRKVASGKIDINDSIVVPESNYPLMIRIKLEYSLVGNIQKVVSRAPYSEIEMRLEDSSSVGFQAATSILAGGVFIDRYIENRDAAAAYFCSEHYFSAMKKIKLIKIHIDNQIRWIEELEYEWYELR
ncbi:hypothetical protein [Cytophaga aurantiaca]|uniref:hypothetical protein n=1 Tax=Cytophaga aurantiaca TaxID=29530 RepID=UPI0003A602E3|nr:hypothetical protein [Cytophaga aurantiaca]